MLLGAPAVIVAAIAPRRRWRRLETALPLGTALLVAGSSLFLAAYAASEDDYTGGRDLRWERHGGQDFFLAAMALATLVSLSLVAWPVVRHRCRRRLDRGLYRTAAVSLWGLFLGVVAMSIGN